MNDRKRLLNIAANMLAAAALTAGFSIYTLYQSAIRQQRHRLMESAQSQARMIEAIVRTREQASKLMAGNGELDSTVARILEAHSNFNTYGETGEFVLARKEGSQIVFILRHRHANLGHPPPIPLRGIRAEPMRRALSGLSGTVVALDYEGKEVLAAHEPVSLLGYGIVAKIEMAEIRGPFLKAFALTSLVGLLVTGLGTALYIFIINPMIARRQESEEKYRQLFESAGDMFFLYDPLRGRLVDINKAGCELLARSHEELIGTDFKEFLAPGRHCDVMARVFSEALASGSGTDVVIFVQQYGNVELEIRCTPLSVQGESRVLGIGRDLTAQRQLERRSLVFYQAFRNSQDYMFFTDRSGTIQDVNDAFTRRFGFAREEAVGETPRIVRSTRTSDLLYASMWGSILDPEKGNWQGRIINRAKGGEEIPILLSITGVRDEQGETVGFVSSGVDLSELESLQYRLAKSESLAAVGSMAAVVAHEIRNPLGSIVTAANSISRGDLEAEDRETLLGIMRKESKRLTDTLSQFLQYARPRDLQLAEGDLVGIVRDVLTMVRSDENALGEIRIEEDFDAGLRPFPMDSDQVRQVVWNIVLNGLQAMQGKGTFSVSVGVDEGRACLRIRDTGPGIPAQEREKIFEPFHTTKQKGSGLGLAVAERIVSAHGGTITLEGAAGRGAEFLIHLPLGKEAI